MRANVSHPERLRGRLTLPKKASPAPTIAHLLPSIELPDNTLEDRELQDWSLALMNAVSAWTGQRLREGVCQDDNLIGKAEASRRLHQELNRLAGGRAK